MVFPKSPELPNIIIFIDKNLNSQFSKDKFFKNLERELNIEFNYPNNTLYFIILVENNPTYYKFRFKGNFL